MFIHVIGGLVLAVVCAQDKPVENKAKRAELYYKETPIQDIQQSKPIQFKLRNDQARSVVCCKKISSNNKQLRVKRHIFQPLKK